VLNLRQKIDNVASDFNLSTAQIALVLGKANDLGAYVRIWQNTLKAILKPSHYLHHKCTVCFLPPFQLHALLRKEADLWDPNHSRKNKRKRKQCVALTEDERSIDVPRSTRAKQSGRTKQTIRSVSKQSSSTPIVLIARGLSVEFPDGGNFTTVRGVSVGVGVPKRRWMFHRWRIKQISWSIELGSFGSNDQ
jgi:hypothetical protein